MGLWGGACWLGGGGGGLAGEAVGDIAVLGVGLVAALARRLLQQRYLLWLVVVHL